MAALSKWELCFLTPFAHNSHSLPCCTYLIICPHVPYHDITIYRDDEIQRAETVSQMILQAYNEKKIKFLPPGLELDDDAMDSPEDNLTLEQFKVYPVVHCIHGWCLHPSHCFMEL